MPPCSHASVAYLLVAALKLPMSSLELDEGTHLLQEGACTGVALLQAELGSPFSQRPGPRVWWAANIHQPAYDVGFAPWAVALTLPRPFIRELRRWPEARHSLVCSAES